MILRLLYAITIGIQMTVLRGWKESEPVQQKKKATTAARRADLCYVGPPKPPTSRPYPIPRGACDHQTPQKESLLTACE